MKTPRPFWRWWVFCAALWVQWHTPSDSRWNAWACRVMSWAVLLEWL